MSIDSLTPDTSAPTNRRRRILREIFDRTMAGLAISGVLAMFGLLALIFLVLLDGAWMAISQIGFHFFTSSVWDPVHDHYGVLAFAYGTVLTTLIALLLAVPVSIGTAVFIVRIAPRWLSGPVSFLVELLAAIPSVVYGLWGAFVMSPWLQNYPETWLYNTLHNIHLIKLGYYPGSTPKYPLPEYFPANLVHGGPSGTDYLAGGLILAIMILPIITAITRDVLLQFPDSIEHGAYALGATWWQTTWLAINYCRVGIFGAAMLGMARAIGETMAIIMVIGNTDRISSSLFAGGQTLTGVFVNEFLEADHPIYVSAMMYVALTLLVSALLTTLAARFMINRIGTRHASEE
ncbi:MAG: phosphate ABC transporter permease subunit PstC [Phycisphaerae bacterium]